MPEFLRKTNQFTEMKILAGPGDEEVAILRERYGYRPEALIEVEASRLDWESSYVGVPAEHPASRAELRVRLQARELLHEHFAMHKELMGEYRINLSREVGYNPDRPNVSRRRMVSFGDAIPPLQSAVDLKVELFRNAAKPWTRRPTPGPPWLVSVHIAKGLEMARRVRKGSGQRPGVLSRSN